MLLSYCKGCSFVVNSASKKSILFAALTFKLSKAFTTLFSNTANSSLSTVKPITRTFFGLKEAISGFFYCFTILLQEQEASIIVVDKSNN